MIVLLIISILVLFLVERWSIRHGLDRITYDVAPSQTLLEPDEEFTVRSTIENHKLWFVPYVSMVENFPSGIQIPGEEESLSTGTVNTNIYVSSNSSAYQELASSQLTTAFYLMPRQRLTRTLQAKLPKRGRYLFLGCRINGGDLLGLQDDYRTLSLFKEVVVMPRTTSWRNAAPSHARFASSWSPSTSSTAFFPTPSPPAPPASTPTSSRGLAAATFTG